MCILFATREHPDYELIMISNRDEFLERKTHSTCWHNDDFILSPYDLARIGAGQSNDTFGTWTGVNRKGRVATVLNLRICDELDMKRMIGERSRGALPFVFLMIGRAILKTGIHTQSFVSVTQISREQGISTYFTATLKKVVTP